MIDNSNKLKPVGALTTTRGFQDVTTAMRDPVAFNNPDTRAPSTGSPAGIYYVYWKTTTTISGKTLEWYHMYDDQNNFLGNVTSSVLDGPV